MIQRQQDKAKKKKTAQQEVWQRFMAGRRRAANEAARQGLPFARQILAWVRKFREHPICTRLLAARGEEELRYVKFYDKDRPGVPTCSLAIFPNGLQWIGYGCCCRWELVETPEELAEAVDPGNLSRAADEIKSGRVWERIKELNQVKTKD